jgi:AcrR family transcriptional regulator
MTHYGKRYPADMSSGVPPSTAYAAVLDENGGRPRGTPADAFRAAVRAFEEGPRLDMGRLAAGLGIAKATLYRWTGSRERLIAEVLSYLSNISFSQALAAATELEGVERVMAVYRHNVGTIVAFEPLRRFVRNETPLALRVLTMRGSIVEVTVSRQMAELLEEEQQRGSLTLRAPAADLAYALTKVTEGFIYSDPVAEIDPDIDAASGIVRLLFE